MINRKHAEKCKQTLQSFFIKSNESLDDYNNRIVKINKINLAHTIATKNIKKADIKSLSDGRNSEVERQIASLYSKRELTASPLLAPMRADQTVINIGDITQRAGFLGLQQGTLPTYIIKTEADLGPTGMVNGTMCYLLKPGHYVLAFPIIPSYKLALVHDGAIGEPSYSFTNLYGDQIKGNVGLYSTFSDGLFYVPNILDNSFVNLYIDVYCGSLTPLVNPWLFNLQNGLIGPSTLTLGPHFVCENLATLGLISADISASVTLNVQKGASIQGVHQPIIINNIQYVYCHGLLASSTTLVSSDHFLEISGATTSYHVYSSCRVAPISSFDMFFASVSDNLGVPDKVHFKDVLVGAIGPNNNVVKEGGGLFGKNSPNILISDCFRASDSYPREVNLFTAVPSNQDIAPLNTGVNVNFGAEQLNQNYVDLVTYTGAPTADGYFLQFKRGGIYSIYFLFGVAVTVGIAGSQAVTFQFCKITSPGSPSYIAIPYQIYKTSYLSNNVGGYVYAFAVEPQSFDQNTFYGIRAVSSAVGASPSEIRLVAQAGTDPANAGSPAVCRVICHSLQ